METVQESELSQLDTKVNKVNVYLKDIYPSLFFGREREYKEPDEEMLSLYGDLRQIGLQKPDEVRGRDKINEAKRAWSNRIKERQARGQRIVFDYFDFSGLDLSKIDLSGISLQNTDFERCNLTGANISRANPVLSNFRNSVLDNVTFEDSFVISADFTGASLRGTNIRANFTYSNFTDATVENSEFDPAGLYKIITTGTKVRSCTPNDDFRYQFLGESQADELRKEMTRKKTPDEIQQEEEIVGEVDSLLDTYKKELSSFPPMDEEIRELYEELRQLGQRKHNTKEEIIILRKDIQKWYKRVRELGRTLNFAGLDFSGLDLSRIDLGGINFAGANFEGTNLSWSNLSGANLILANFRRANLHMSSLRGSLPLNANFSEANLSACRLKETIFIKAKFNGANIEYAGFQNTVLLGADFTNATVIESFFNGASGVNTLSEAGVLENSTY